MLEITEGRISLLNVKIVLSHNTESLRRETLRCFTKFLVLKNFVNKEGGVKDYNDFFFKFFSSHIAQYIVTGPFRVFH